jgi:hypothetical protein
MKTSILFALLPLLFITSSAQKPKWFAVSVTNTNSAVPFNKLVGLVTGVYHPGFEIGYGSNWKTKKKHDWYHELRLGYFYHRFVQHAVPVYANVGYRYKFSKSFIVETSLGAGYLHSIPATAKLKLNNNGEYTNNKGVGRMQAIAAYNIGIGYTINVKKAKPLTIFTAYQQSLQFPFIHSYVPLLPYNTLKVGVRLAIK